MNFVFVELEKGNIRAEEVGETMIHWETVL